jgi:hypothetical protein
MKNRGPKLLFLFVILASSAFSQSPASAKSPTSVPAKKCEAQLARLLVDQLASDSKSIEETDKRVNVLIKVADFLWIPDVESARPLFAEAFQIARDRYKEKGRESSTDKGGMIRIQPDYRFHVIRAIAKRDAKWARTLTEIVLKDKQEEADEAKQNPFGKDREVGEMIQIAIALLETDQASALLFLRRAMQFPLKQDWIYALYNIYEKNPALADQIYTEVLNNYASAVPSKLLYLSFYPFAASRMIGLGRYNLSTSLPAGLRPNSNLQRQFLSVFLRRVAALTNETAGLKAEVAPYPESSFAFSALVEIEPIILRQFPDLAELFSQARTNIAALMTPESLNTVAETERQQGISLSSFEERLKNLEKADDEGKLTDNMIASLITGLKKEEHFEALESWLDKIVDEKARKQSFNYFYFSRSKLATKEARFEDARKYADKIEQIEHRAVLYFDIAEARIKDPATKFDALDSLNEVYKMAQKAPDTVEKAQVFLGLAFVYEGVDHLNALDSLSNAIKTAGKLNTPNLMSSYISQQITGKNFSIFTTYSVPGFDVSGTFYKLSNKDFQGTLTQAEGFTDRYLRTLAVLAVVKDCEKSMKPAEKPKAKAKP